MRSDRLADRATWFRRANWLGSFGTYRGELIFPFAELAFDDVASTGMTSGKGAAQPK